MPVGQFPQLLADRGDGVVLLVHRERLGGDQSSLLRTEEEHEAHHDREGRFVKNGFGNLRNQLTQVGINFRFMFDLGNFVTRKENERQSLNFA